MREIPLTQGLVALVDDSDYEAVSQFRWYAHRQRRFNVYAKRSVADPTRRQRQLGVSMHCWLLGALGVDHINGDGLDNRRANLRVATPQQNRANCHAVEGTSLFRGVYLYKRSRRWVAQINHGGHKVWIGVFVDQEAAARAYDEHAREVFGEFAALNFPKPGEQSARRTVTRLTAD